MQGDTEVPINEDKIDFHFVCFIESHENRCLEVDVASSTLRSLSSLLSIYLCVGLLYATIMS